MDKTKVMVTGKKAKEKIQSGRWPCGCCGRGVGVNSVLCTVCKKWNHQCCSKLRNLRGVQNFARPRHEQEEEKGNDRREEEHIGTAVNDFVPEELEQFCYLGDMLDCKTGVEGSVRAKVAAAWGKMAKGFQLSGEP